MADKIHLHIENNRELGPVFETTKARLAAALKAHPEVAAKLKVSIGYDVPWRQVHALLQDAAQRTPGVVARPAAQVLQRGLSDFYVEYELICQLDPAEPRAYILSRLHASIRDVFEEAGVEILSPHYEAQIQVEPAIRGQT